MTPVTTICTGMEDFPRTILEFEERSATEEARHYIAQLRWPEGFCCPRCGHRVLVIGLGPLDVGGAVENEFGFRILGKERQGAFYHLPRAPAQCFSSSDSSP